MALDLSTLSADDLVALKARLDSLTDVSGRSPMRPRQLTDLRLLPTATDPRPTFFMSAEPPRNAGDLTRTTPFPMLLWHQESGTEITVHSAKEQAVYEAAGYAGQPPFEIELDPMDVLAAQIEALSEGDRAALIESQRQDRIAAMRAKLAEMPEDKLAILLGQVGTAAEPAKRGPGRPRKEVTA